ncbi:hypothetical protein [Nocardia sp. CA-120079]|uniref:hypothetical protein n=1 Tax=Nocardia sp. CA-120079 TaxID=3239974 RepID=UPI003D9918DD
MNDNPTQNGPLGCVVEVDRSPSNDPRTEAFAANLTTSLLALVPKWIATTRHWTDEQLQRAAPAAAQTIASHGDDLQYGGTKRGQALNAVAKALAILAHTEGGVTALGIHACQQPHHPCPAQRPRTTKDPEESRTLTTTTDTAPTTTPVVALRIEPAELHTSLRETFMHESLSSPPNPFAESANWSQAWAALLADAVEEADEGELLINPATGHTVELTVRVHDRADAWPHITIELDDAETLDQLATHTYTSPPPERPDRTKPGTWECAAADATHALLTVLADLNRAAATPPAATPTTPADPTAA